MNIKTKLLSLSASAALLILSAPAQAAFSWDFDTSPANTGDPSGTSITATASAWATSTTGITSGLQSATLQQWSGLGIKSHSGDGGSPQHAIDADGRKESVLFSFSQSIALTKVYMSWVGRVHGSGYSADADFSLLRYTGAGGPSLAGQSYSDLLTPAGGWEMVGKSYYSGGYNVGSGNTANVNAGMLSSSYWLVAAANTALGWSSGYTGNDYFKLRKLYGKTTTPPPPGIPSPSTLPLLAISLLGLGFASRRKKRA